MLSKRRRNGRSPPEGTRGPRIFRRPTDGLSTFPWPQRGAGGRRSAAANFRDSYWKLSCFHFAGAVSLAGMMKTQPKLLTVGQMARRLRVPVKWLREEAEAGRVPHLKAGRAILFDPEATEAALVKRAKQGGVNG